MENIKYVGDEFDDGLLYIVTINGIEYQLYDDGVIIEVKS